MYTPLRRTVPHAILKRAVIGLFPKSSHRFSSSSLTGKGFKYCGLKSCGIVLLILCSQKYKKKEIINKAMMAGSSLRIGISNLVVVIILHNSIMISEGYQIDSRMYNLVEEIERSLPPSLTQIEEVSPPQLDTLYHLVEKSDSFITSLMDFLNESRYINEQYEKLNEYKAPTEDDEMQLMTLNNFANVTTSGSPSASLSNRLDRFIGTIIPNSDHEGIFHMYSTYIKNRENQWCKERQSVSYFIYSSFQYSLNIIRKGYSVILQSYIIRGASDKVDFTANLDSMKKKYKAAVKSLFEVFNKLEIGVSTRITPCHPDYQIEGTTYLEMEKLLQGVLPQEITLNDRNSGKGGCDDYGEQGTAYYPYENIRHDGDWKCHGLMYSCFRIPQLISICKPSSPTRRINGVIDSGKNFETYEGMGRVDYSDPSGCGPAGLWTYFYWRHPLPFSMYQLEQCACICDDFEHPKTLRKFSREYAMSDYQNNMVVTGIRLVNISNVIHIQVQEGKLEKYGSINPTTVQWRLKNDIVNRGDDLSSRSSDEVITLSYHKRRVNLGLINFEPTDVVIGAAFDWDQEGKGVELVIFGTVFSFLTGELSQDYRKRHGPSEARKEIVLENPHMPFLCHNFVPIRGNDKFIKFQTTDWKKDAAQTTIPFLDIQPVIANPPVMLRGIGLYYKNAAGCGGYIGFELYSHEYEHFMTYNDTLY